MVELFQPGLGDAKGIVRYQTKEVRITELVPFSQPKVLDKGNDSGSSLVDRLGRTKSEDPLEVQEGGKQAESQHDRRVC